MTEATGPGHKQNRADARSASAIISAIVILLIYQGYTLSVVGVASPWIAKSFGLTEPQLAGLFAWISSSAIGALILARLADRLGRRRIILASLMLSPLLAAGAAVAPNAGLFAAFQILIAAMLGGSVSSAIVLLAEELPTKMRARGQAFAAFASAIGGVLAYMVIPFLVRWGSSWRWLLAPSVAGLALVAPVARMLPASEHWKRAASSGEVASSHLYDIFSPLYRRRSLTLLTCAALDTVAGTAVNGWLYFEAVSVIGLSPTKASMLVVVGMVVGMGGFPIGAWSSDRFGRVPTVSYVGGIGWLGAVAFYWGPLNAAIQPFAWMLAAYCWFKMGTGIMTVGANAAATELLPASLRTTMIGCQGITAAIFSMLAQAIIAGMIGPLGGLAKVIRLLALLGIPSAIIFRVFIDETGGLPIEIAAREAEWAAIRRAQAHPNPVRASE